MLLVTEEESKEEDLLTAGLDDQVWSTSPLLNSQEYLCIHEVPRPATPPNQQSPHPIPATPPPQPNQGVPVTPPLQPDQLEMPPNNELM